jgi:23S rRNA pseudouridine1911/1915/1917 synthase
MITQLKREKDGILMNGKILRSIDPVEAGARIVINLPREQMQIEPVSGELDILFEDDALLILNKPPLMPVHPVKQHQTDTLANLVAYRFRGDGSFVFRAVNRLDRNTSGLVMIAKDRFAVNKMKNAVEKRYLALVHGKTESSGTIDAPIGLRPDSNIFRCITENGSRAVTHYKTLASCKEISLLELTLETGRTHQIRCHMSAIGHPLAGDDLYGGCLDLFQRQALHCRSVILPHPITKDLIELTAPFPEDFSVLFKSTSP